VAENVTGNPATDLFTPPAFTIVDVTAYVNITDWATLRAGVFNLFDETYWWWSDVRGVAWNSATLDAYTQPGRNFSASLVVRF
jgi:hemoglobin/transferrin/lactoferrin receptor protein